jgi:hypothetical protein
VHCAQTAAHRGAKMRGMAKPQTPATGGPVNDDVKQSGAAPDAAADQEAAKTIDAAPPANMPRTFQAFTKLNPGLDPFIFFGF